jgi:integrase
VRPSDTNRDGAAQRAVRVVPHPCQNERKITVISGHLRALRTAWDLGACRLTPCLKRPSKQRVAGSNPAGRAGELRHTFVSLLSAHGVPVEAIALLAGHNQTSTTELVYRHQIVPALTRGAEVMDEIFG